MNWATLNGREVLSLGVAYLLTGDAVGAWESSINRKMAVVSLQGDLISLL